MSCLSLIVVKPISSYSRQKEGELKRRVSEFRLKEEQTKERLQYSEQEGATAITIIEDQVRQESIIIIIEDQVRIESNYNAVLSLRTLCVRCGGRCGGRVPVCTGFICLSSSYPPRDSASPLPPHPNLNRSTE